MGIGGASIGRSPRQGYATAVVQVPGSDKGPSEALRNAIERTFEATAGSAAETRDRAAALLDEVVRRGREAREASSAKVGDAIQGLRERDEVRRLEAELGTITERLERLESALRGRQGKKP
jgi:polyhydroxyalkanoate synthesis regulator phasin